MAAAYSTGTATGPVDLLQKLVTWLAAQGWTADANAAEGSGWRAHLHKGSPAVYVNLRAAVNEQIWQYRYANGYGIGMNLGDGYSSGAGWNVQSGAPLQYSTAYGIGAGMELASGAVTAYHFFDDGSDHITVVVERTPGLFVHMGWGLTLPPLGFTDPYPYFFGSSPSYMNTGMSGSYPNPGNDLTAATPMSEAHYYPSDYASSAFVRVPSAVYSGRWVGNGYSTGTAAGYTGRIMRSILDTVTNASAIQYTPNYKRVESRAWSVAYPGALILPMHSFVAMSTGRYAPVGYPPDVFYCLASAHGFTAGEVWAVGGVNYMVFPNFVVLKAA